VRRAPALWPAGAAAALLLGLSFYVLQRWLERGRLADVPIYQGYAQMLRAGAVPYRDFPVVYPPAALPAFLLPSYMPWSYATSFAVAMGICGAGCIAAAALALRALRTDRVRSAAALLLIGLSPLVLGSLFDTRFDLWPALLAVASLAAVLRGRPRAFGLLAGLAFSAKFWPFALVPIGLAYLWRVRGRRPALEAAGTLLLTAAVCFLPFAVLAPAGVGHSFGEQLGRPLQVESLGASILVAAQHLGWITLRTATSHGSQNLTGSAPDAVAAVSSVVEVAALIGIWALFARLRRPSAEAAVVGSVAAVATVVAFGKVFSPQYLIWLVPLVPLVRGRRGALASALLLAALGLTQAWFPDNYWTLALGHSDPFAAYLVLRNLAVVGIAAVLARPDMLQDRALRDDRARGEPLPAARPQME
jgi:uncharacterized membrane protein